MKLSLIIASYVCNPLNMSSRLQHCDYIFFVIVCMSNILWNFFFITFQFSLFVFESLTDIVVGAPYGGPDGKGAIYIYHGSANGIGNGYEPVQVKLLYLSIHSYRMIK